MDKRENRDCENYKDRQKTLEKYKKKKNLNEQKPRLKRLERKLQKLYPDKENQTYAKSIRIEKVHIFK